MTTRHTSIEAYDHLIKTGQLKGQQRAAMAGIINRPGATSGEVLDALGIRNANAWRARWTELQARGLIRETGERKCRISGRLCVTWEATDRMKPLDMSKGARATGDVKAWRRVAERLAAQLSRYIGHHGPTPEASNAVIAYTKLITGAK